MRNVTTLPETNMAPETMGLEDEFSFWVPASRQVFGSVIFWGGCLLRDNLTRVLFEVPKGIYLLFFVMFL